jgi:hypothetical protein
MKKQLVILSILIFIFACKKNNSIPYYLNVHVGNSTYSFDSVISVDTGGQQISIVAVNSKIYDSRVIFGMISNIPLILTGTYTDDVTAAQYIHYMSFSYSTGSDSNLNEFGYYLTSGPFVLTIDEFNSSYMSGTFSGRVVPSNFGSDTLISGEFRINAAIIKR